MKKPLTILLIVCASFLLGSLLAPRIFIPKVDRIWERNCLVDRVVFNDDSTRYTFYLHDGNVLTFKEACLVRETIPISCPIYIRYAYMDDNTAVLLSIGIGFKFGETIR